MLDILLEKNTKLRFDYTNWRGEKAVRTAQVQNFILGSNEWHPEPQILMEAIDLEKGATRFFAVKDMENIQIIS